MMTEILVFRTSIESREEVLHLAPLLNAVAGLGNWNFALEDCDRILRVRSSSTNARQIIRLLTGQGFTCQELEDVVPEPLSHQTETAA